MALRRATRLAGVASGTGGGILLAVCGADPSTLEPLLVRARGQVGPDVRLEAALIAASDPAVSLLRLAGDRPNAALAAPLGVEFETPWYEAAVKAVIACRTCPVYAFYIDEGMVEKAKEEARDRSGLGSLVGAVLRSSARLRLGVRSLMKGGTR
jgi:hypothetical protein